MELLYSEGHCGLIKGDVLISGVYYRGVPLHIYTTNNIIIMMINNMFRAYVCDDLYRMIQ